MALEPQEEMGESAALRQTLRHWWPLLCSVGGMLAAPELLRPLLGRCLPGGRPNLEVYLFALSALVNAAVVVLTWDPAAAGTVALLVSAAVLCALSGLLVGLALGLRCRRGAAACALTTPPEMLLADAEPLLSFLLRGFSALLAVHVVTQESSEWGQLLVPLGLVMLCLSLAASNVPGSLLAHVNIRLDGRIVEGSCILFKEKKVLLRQLKWRHTVGLVMPTRSTIYIPNRQLVDSVPIVETSEFAIHVGFEGETLRDGGLREAVKGASDLLAVTAVEGFSFVGGDGRTYRNRFDTSQCEVSVNDTGDTLHLKLVGRPALQDCETADLSGRHGDRGWHLQVEWLNLRLRSFCRGLAF